MSDTIYRQDAISELCKMLKECFAVDDEIIDAVDTTMRELPPAQPENKQQALHGGKIVTKVNCFLEKCVYCKDYTCTKDEITLDEEHYCGGGCDEGWEFQSEKEDE